MPSAVLPAAANNQIQGTLPSALRNLTGLRKLALNSNLMQATVSEWLGELQSLLLDKAGGDDQNTVKHAATQPSCLKLGLHALPAQHHAMHCTCHHAHCSSSNNTGHTCASSHVQELKVRQPLVVATRSR